MVLAQLLQAPTWLLTCCCVPFPTDAACRPGILPRLRVRLGILGQPVVGLLLLLCARLAVAVTAVDAGRSLWQQVSDRLESRQHTKKLFRACTSHTYMH